MMTQTGSTHSIKAEELLDVLGARLVDVLPFDGVIFTGYNSRQNVLMGLGGAGITLGPRVRQWRIDGPAIAMAKVNGNAVVPATTTGRSWDGRERIRPLWAAKEILKPFGDFPEFGEKLRRTLEQSNWGESDSVCRPVPNEFLDKYFEFSSSKALDIGSLSRINLNGSSGWDYRIEDVPAKIKAELLEPIDGVKKPPESQIGGETPQERDPQTMRTYTEGSVLKEIMAFPLAGKGATENESAFTGMLVFDNPHRAMLEDRRLQKLTLTETARLGSQVSQIIQDLHLIEEGDRRGKVFISGGESPSVLLESIEGLLASVGDADPEVALDRTTKLVLPSRNPMLLSFRDHLVKMLQAEIETVDVMMEELTQERGRAGRILRNMAVVFGLLSVEALLALLAVWRLSQ